MYYLYYLYCLYFVVGYTFAGIMMLEFVPLVSCRITWYPVVSLVLVAVLHLPLRAPRSIWCFVT